VYMPSGAGPPTSPLPSQVMVAESAKRSPEKVLCGPCVAWTMTTFQDATESLFGTVRPRSIVSDAPSPLGEKPLAEGVMAVSPLTGGRSSTGR
jgi:hypothetical protein